jgi:hypothetical protein
MRAQTFPSRTHNHNHNHTTMKARKNTRSPGDSIRRFAAERDINDNIERFQKMAANYLSLNSMAKALAPEYGISHSSIRNILRDRDVERYLPRRVVITQTPQPELPLDKAPAEGMDAIDVKTAIFDYAARLERIEAELKKITSAFDIK